MENWGFKNMTTEIEAFIHYLEDVKQSSRNTVVSYQRDLRQLKEYLERQGIEEPSRVTKTSLNAYISYLQRKGKATTTISRILASTKAFFHYEFMEGNIHRDPAELLKTPKIEKKIPLILSVEEVNRFLEQPDGTSAKQIRHKAMLELLYATGIRVSELINLNVQDINLRTGKLFCRGTKGVRTIPIYAKAVVAVSDYLYRMRDLIVDPDNSGDALFVNLNGSRLTRQGFWKIIKAYTAEAGITKEITPHTLRHSFAMHLLQGGASVKDIQTMMGHADISSTQVYVHLLDLDNHVKSVYNECHPRAKTS